MVNEDSSHRWFRLSPDSGGGYRNGTWSPLADAGVARLYYDSAVLADGRVLDVYPLVGGRARLTVSPSIETLTWDTGW